MFVLLFYITAESIGYESITTFYENEIKETFVIILYCFPSVDDFIFVNIFQDKTT